MTTSTKPNLFFNFRNKEFVSRYVKYLETKKEFEKLDRLLEQNIISIDSTNNMIIIHDLIKFCKYYFDLRYNLSAEFLVCATEKCRLFYRRNLEPEIFTNLIWMTLQRRKTEFINANTKRCVINELIDKNIIIKYGTHYKHYLLNIDNPDVRMLLEYLIQGI